MCSPSQNLSLGSLSPEQEEIQHLDILLRETLLEFPRWAVRISHRNSHEYTVKLKIKGIER